MIEQSKWEWFGAPGHFICAYDCRFHLCTLVGKYVVSTVGELWSCLPGEGGMLKEIGAGRLYETMVFEFKGRCEREYCNCSLPEIIPKELDMDGYNRRGDAQRGHLAMCLKYANLQ